MANPETVFHVTSSRAGDKWLVSQEGQADEDEFDTKEKAVEAAKKLAQAHGPSQLKVHSTDGAVEYEASYPEDPLVRQLAEYGF